MDMLNHALTARQVTDAVRSLEGEDLNPRTLAAWANMGIAVPSVAWEQKKGRHHPRIYSMADLARIRLVVRLRRHGISMPKVRAVLAYLQDELQEALSRKTTATLIVDGWRGSIVRRAQNQDLEVPSGQFRLPLADVVKGNEESVREALEAA